MTLAKPILAGLCFLPSILAQSPRSLDVKVVDSVHHGGVADAELEFRPDDQGVASVRAVTAMTGSVAVPNLTPGSYRVYVKKRGFEPRDPQGTPLQWQPSITPTELVLTVIPHGSIAGRVVDADGEPLPRVAIEIFRPSRRGERRGMLTNGDGAYRFDGLAPGTYLMNVLPGSNMSAGGDRVIWAPAYYPGDRNETTAEPITISPGEQLADRDVRLRPASAVRIDGTVVDESGHPASDLTVTLQPAGSAYLPGRTPPEGQSRSRKDGAFVFPKVGEGDWFLSVRNGFELGGSTSVRAVRHDLEGVRIQLSKPFTVNVNLAWEGSDPPDRGRGAPQIMLIPVDGPADYQSYSDARGPVKQSIHHVYPGRYRVSPPVPPGYYLASLRLGETEALGREIELKPSSPPLYLEYKRNGGQLSGIVRNCDGCTLIVWPEGLDVPELLQIVPCDPAGAFRSDVLRPGRYRVWAFDRVDWDAWSIPALRHGLEQLATGVNVEAGVNLSIELRVTSWSR